MTQDERERLAARVLNYGWPPRWWTRPMWLTYHRQLRINRRECDKAFMDTVLFGCGFTRVSPGGITHIPYETAVYMSLTPTFRMDGPTYE